MLNQRTKNGAPLIGDSGEKIDGQPAGELMIDLHPELFAPLREIYASGALQTALGRAHLYFAVARPQITVKIIENPILGNLLQFESAPAPEFEAVSFSCAQMTAAEKLEGDMPAVHFAKLKVDDFGRRLVFEIGEHEALNLSANIMAALNSPGLDTSRNVSRWKIVYIGKSYGTGDGSLIKRLRRHEVVQRVLDEYLSIGWEVNIVPVTVASTMTVFIMTEYEGPEMEYGQIQALVSLDGELESPQLVSLIENALIAYFKPEYNAMLLTWPSAQEVGMFDNVGVASVQTHFDASGDIYQLFTAHRPLPTRGFSIRSYLRGAKIQEDATLTEPRNEMDAVRIRTTKQQLAKADRSLPRIKIFEDQIFAI